MARTEIQFPLTTWDQIGPRNYVRQVYCFPSSEAIDVGRLRQALAHAISNACAECPDFAARVVLPNSATGKLYLSHHPENQAVLTVRYDASYPYTYAELKRRGFPGGAFVGPEFTLAHHLEAGGPGMPVMQIDARVITGGLLLGIYIHHATTDGIGMAKFIACLAKYTDRSCARPKSRAPRRRADLEIPRGLVLRFGKYTHQELMDQCPEYCTLSDLSGPLGFRIGSSDVPFGDIPKRGCIFTFTDATIATLKSIIASCSPSASSPPTFACIVSLTWIFTTLARLQAQNKVKGPQTQCSLTLPASWARRAFPSFSDSHAGNAVSMAKLYAPLSGLTVAASCSRNAVAPGNTAFAQIVCAITAHLDAINEEYIAKRTCMIRSAPDPRSVCVNLDPLDPCDFIMNSWRHLGADTQWRLPGVSEGNVFPDAVRRAQNEWNMGAGLVLPGQKDSNAYEILVTLEAESMSVLRADRRWMGWVDGAME